MQSDDELLAAWGGGDEAAGQALLARYYTNIVRFFDVRAAADAEDLTQKTFLTCLERRHSLRDGGRFRGFLFGIARNHLLHYIRDRGRRGGGGELDDFASEEPSPSRIVAMYEEQRLLLRAMQLISVDAQMVLQLYYWEYLQVGDIGVALGLPVSTVTTRLARARKSLLDAVGRVAAVERSRVSLVGDFERWLSSFSGLGVEAPMPRDE
jgi:RNA polymerase sigma factor (sigma-70 family)